MCVDLKNCARSLFLGFATCQFVLAVVFAATESTPIPDMAEWSYGDDAERSLDFTLPFVGGHFKELTNPLSLALGPEFVSSLEPIKCSTAKDSQSGDRNFWRWAMNRAVKGIDHYLWSAIFDQAKSTHESEWALWFRPDEHSRHHEFTVALAKSVWVLPLAGDGCVQQQAYDLGLKSCHDFRCGQTTTAEFMGYCQRIIPGRASSESANGHKPRMPQGNDLAFMHRDSLYTIRSSNRPQHEAVDAKRYLAVALRNEYNRTTQLVNGKKKRQRKLKYIRMSRYGTSDWSWSDPDGAEVSGINSFADIDVSVDGKQWLHVFGTYCLKKAAPFYNKN